MPTILHLSPTGERGGTETQVWQLTKGLADQGWRSVVVTGTDGWLCQVLQELGVETIIIPGLVESRWPRPGEIAALLRIIRRCRVNLIHSLSFDMSCYGALAARLARLPFLPNLRSVHLDLATRRRRWAWRMVIAPAARRIVAVSQDTARALAAGTGIRYHRFQVIPNGVAVHPLPNQGRRRLVRSSLGLSEDALMALAVGRLHPIKGYDLLLTASAQVAACQPRFILMVAGRCSEPTHSQLVTQSVQLALEERVRFLGHRQDVPDLLAAADVFVLPSYSEGMSNALLEALAAGQPCVATSVGVNSEVLAHGVTGLLVPPADSGAMAQALTQMLGDADTRRSMGLSGRRRAAEQFGLPAMIARYRGLFTEALGHTPRAAAAAC